MQVAFPEAMARLLVRVLQEIAATGALDDEASLLTDRTFLVRAPRVIRGAAMLDGRSEAAPADLHVLRLLTAFRLPADVHAQVRSYRPVIITGQVSQGRSYRTGLTV